MLNAVAVLGVDQREEFLARLLRAEGAQHRRGDGRGMLLLDAAHHHAEWRASTTTPTPRRLNDLLDGLGDLDRKPLLHLQAAGEDFDQTRGLAKADDLSLGM